MGCPDPTEPRDPLGSPAGILTHVLAATGAIACGDSRGHLAYNTCCGASYATVAGRLPTVPPMALPNQIPRKGWGASWGEERLRAGGGDHRSQRGPWGRVANT